jgi:hypothetical protein
MGYAALGLAALGLLYLLLRWFATTPTRDLARAFKTFAAVFSALASTGLLLTGRVGLAFVTVAATVMAVRSLMQGPQAADPFGGVGQQGPASNVETALLAMRLDHATGEVEGRVKRGGFAGRELSAMGLGELAALLEEARREDPRSVPLVEAYLDRRDPDWRGNAAGAAAGAEEAPPASSAGAMDERTALEVLGLAPGATEAEIKAAHRELMARLHPDHGGSSYLAAQINRARDYLLGRR